MKRKDVIRLALEAGIDAEADTLCRHEGWVEPLQKLIELVEAEALKSQQQAINAAVMAEREACAKLCDSLMPSCYDADECATAIRARPQPAPTTEGG